jgi:hypothetical protein
MAAAGVCGNLAAMASIHLHDCLDPTTGALDPSRLRATLCAVPTGELPLRDACLQGGLVLGDVEFAQPHCHSHGDHHAASVGVFFYETVGGCSCHDEPVAHPVQARLCLDWSGGTDTAELRLCAEDA